jgi:hypothetical protein
MAADSLQIPHVRCTNDTTYVNRSAMASILEFGLCVERIARGKSGTARIRELENRNDLTMHLERSAPGGRY